MKRSIIQRISASIISEMLCLLLITACSIMKEDRNEPIETDIKFSIYKTVQNDSLTKCSRFFRINTYYPGKGIFWFKLYPDRSAITYNGAGIYEVVGDTIYLDNFQKDCYSKKWHKQRFTLYISPKGTLIAKPIDQYSEPAEYVPIDFPFCPKVYDNDLSVYPIKKLPWMWEHEAEWAEWMEQSQGHRIQ